MNVVTKQCMINTALRPDFTFYRCGRTFLRIDNIKFYQKVKKNSYSRKNVKKTRLILGAQPLEKYIAYKIILLNLQSTNLPFALFYPLIVCSH